MEAFLSNLAVQHPAIAGLCVALVAFRAVFKPLMSLVHTIVESTPSKSDDETLSKIEQSRAYKALVWIVDYLLSIKLPVVKDGVVTLVEAVKSGDGSAEKK